MIKILLLGAGQQGRAALYDLVHSPQVHEVIVADLDLNTLQAYVQSQNYGERVHCERLDAGSVDALQALGARKPDVVLDLLPPAYSDLVAAAAVAHGAHLVNTNYTTPGIRALAETAAGRGVSLLPEFGLDPGIDLVLLGAAVRSLDTVESLVMYGAGLPEPDAADNPLRYKVSWSFPGVLNTYRRPARLKRNGREIPIPANRLFAPENIHTLPVEGLGALEAFPNGDALQYADLLGLDRANLQDVGRYTLRWPGHCERWQDLVDLGLLEADPVLVDGRPVDRISYLAAALEPVLQYGENERDLALIRVEVAGRRESRPVKIIHQVLDWRDRKTGHTAMSRTVGYTASIGAQWLATGALAMRGLLSPVRDISLSFLRLELERQGIAVVSEEITDPAR